MLAVLTERTLKARYRGSILGVYWSLLNPLLMTIVYTSVFGSAFAKYYDNSIVRYALSVFIGLAVIQFFAGATTQALPSVVVNSALLNKIKIPMEILPSSTVAAHSVQLAIGVFPLLVVMTLAVTHDPLRVLLLPFPLIGLVLLSGGVAYLVSTAYVYFRDIPHVYELVTFVAWVTVPVFYPAAIVPEHVRHLLYFNPLFPTITSLQDLAIGSGLPNFTAIAASLGTGIVAAALGLLVFEWRRPEFMDLI